MPQERGRPRKLPMEDTTPKEEPKAIEEIAELEDLSVPEEKALDFRANSPEIKPIVAGEKITGRGAFRKPEAQFIVDGQHVSVREMAQEESRRVVGRFTCFSPIGGEISFYFRKYRGQPIEKYHLKDGEVYELPLSVARHLHEDCYEEVHALSLDRNGKSRTDRGKRIKRFEFVPVGF